MVAGERERLHDDHWRFRRRATVCGQGIAHDRRALLRVQRPTMQGDPGASMSPAVRRRAEAGDDIGPTIVTGVAEHHEIAAGRTLVTAEVRAAPGIDVDIAVRRDDDVPRVADAVGEDGRTESRWQRETTVVAGTRLRRRRARRRCRIGLRGPALAAAGSEDSDCREDAQSMESMIGHGQEYHLPGLL